MRWYSRANSLSSFACWSSSEFGSCQDLGDVLREILVDKLEFGDAVFVVERNGVPVINRLLEVVDRDVIAENLLRPFLPGHQWRSGEADERSVRQGIPHVQGEDVVLAPVRLIGDDDDV